MPFFSWFCWGWRPLYSGRVYLIITYLFLFYYLFSYDVKNFSNEPFSLFWITVGLGITGQMKIGRSVKQVLPGFRHKNFEKYYDNQIIYNCSQNLKNISRWNLLIVLGNFGRKFGEKSVKNSGKIREILLFQYGMPTLFNRKFLLFWITWENSDKFQLSFCPRVVRLRLGGLVQ